MSFRGGVGPSPHPWLLLQSGHHDDGVGPLLPHHPPEVAQRLRQRALSGDVGVLLPVAVDVVGVDVVAARNGCDRERQRPGYNLGRTACKKRVWLKEPMTAKLSECPGALVERGGVTQCWCRLKLIRKDQASWASPWRRFLIKLSL